MKLLLVGGGAMALRGEKGRTKDVDVLLRTDKDLDRVTKALRTLGYRPPRLRPAEYDKLQVRAILEDEERFSYDLFVKRVAGRFSLTPSVEHRGELWRRIRDVEVLLASREDIFLSKAVTERAGDLDDMATLYRRGLDATTILEECRIQNSYSDTIWEAFLALRLGELEEHADLTVPWKKRIERAAELKLARVNVLELLSRGSRTRKEIAETLGEGLSFVERVLAGLEDEGQILVDRSGRPYRYSSA